MHIQFAVILIPFLCFSIIYILRLHKIDEVSIPIGHEKFFGVMVARRLSDVTKPEGLKYQSSDEAEYLKLHKCVDHGEVYAASYLITKKHIMTHKIDYNLSECNTEFASFMLMDTSMDAKRDKDGTLIQSLDVLDFSVIHLSAFERLQRRHGYSEKTKANKLDAIKNATVFLKERAMIAKSNSSFKYRPEAIRTVAIMPFLGSEVGAGNSLVANRLHYLRACFWSLYYEFPHVVAVVKNTKDQDIARNFSELPFFDVLVASHIPTSSSLPVACLQMTRQKLADGSWDFDYIYFTESDQVLMMRQHEAIFSHLVKYPRRVLVPHRLIPYPSFILKNYKREKDASSLTAWEGLNCCMPRQNCVTRSTWVSPMDKALSFLQIFGLQVALGNCNFHAESFRACKLYPNGGIEVCP